MFSITINGISYEELMIMCSLRDGALDEYAQSQLRHIVEVITDDNDITYEITSSSLVEFINKCHYEIGVGSYSILIDIELDNHRNFIYYNQIMFIRLGQKYVELPTNMLINSIYDESVAIINVLVRTENGTKSIDYVIYNDYIELNLSVRFNTESALKYSQTNKPVRRIKEKFRIDILEDNKELLDLLYSSYSETLDYYVEKEYKDEK